MNDATQTQIASPRWEFLRSLRTWGSEQTRQWLEQSIRSANLQWPGREWPLPLPEESRVLEVSAFDLDPGTDISPHLLAHEPEQVLQGALLWTHALSPREVSLIIPAGEDGLRRSAGRLWTEVGPVWEAATGMPLPGLTIRELKANLCSPAEPSAPLSAEILVRLARAFTHAAAGESAQADLVLRQRYVRLMGDLRQVTTASVEPGETGRELIWSHAGGLAPGSRLTGLVVGGLSGVAVGAAGADKTAAELLADPLLSTSLLVMTERTCPVKLLSLLIHLSASESCAHTGVRPVLTQLDESLLDLTRGRDSMQLSERLDRLTSGLAGSECPRGRSVARLVSSFLSVFESDVKAHLQGHCRASICEDLFPSPCQNACPAGVNVPGQLALLRRGKPVQALALGRVSNPLLIACGYVCEEPPCQAVCRRRQIDEPLNTPLLHRRAAGSAYADAGDWVEALAPSTPSRPLAPSGKRVAVIGAGPAGLSAAYFLARYGHAVELFEALPGAGGMLSYGIPAYRMPRAVVGIEVDDICRQGVIIHYGKRLGADFSLADLQGRFQAAVLALGAQRPMRLSIPGEDLSGVFHGVDFLRRIDLGEPTALGRHAIVIGGGNVALDTARTAWRLGADEVHLVCLEGRHEMPAHEGEIAQALEEGIQIHPGFGPEQIEAGPDGILKVTFRPALQVFDRAGRFRPQLAAWGGMVLEGSSVLVSIGQTLDARGAEGVDLVRGDRAVAVREDGTSTSLPWLFAAGDCVTGTTTVVEAVSGGRRAARAVDRFLGSDPILKDQLLESNWRWPVPPYPVETRERAMLRPSRLPPEERRSREQFQEAALPPEATRAEWERCLCVARPGPGRHWDQ